MHPLTKLINNKLDIASNILGWVDDDVVDYLKSRAEWLEEEMVGTNYSIRSLLKKAFELDEKCEPIYGICSERGKKMEVGTVEKIKPTLPSKINIEEGEYIEMRLINAVNELIDYLLTKEAREVER